MAITPRATTVKAKEGYKFKDWAGELVETDILVDSDASFGRGVIYTSTEGEVRVPDHDDDLGEGATDDEASLFAGILLGDLLIQPDCVVSGEMSAETLGTPVGRDDEGFFEKDRPASYMKVGFIGAIPEQAVVKGDPVFMRISDAAEVSGKVLGGFRKDADTDQAVEIPGLFWGSAADALSPTYIEMNIK